MTLRRLTFDLEGALLDYHSNEKVSAVPLAEEPRIIEVDIRNILTGSEHNYSSRLQQAVEKLPYAILEQVVGYVAGDRWPSLDHNSALVPVQFYK